MRNSIWNTRAACRAALACAVAFSVLVSGRAARAQSGAVPDFNRITQQVTDSTQAKDAAKTLRAYLSGKPDSTYLTFARLMLVQALLTSRAPEAELLDAVDQSEKVLPDRTDARVAFYATLGRSLAERGLARDRALAYVKKAVALCPKDPESGRLMSLAQASLGQVQLIAGQPAEAALALSQAVADAPDSQAVLALLGQAYEKSGKPTSAVAAYLRSASAFPGRDTVALAPLRALWKKQHGSLAGLDERLKTQKKEAVRHVALESHAIAGKKVAPAWRLPDLDENIRDLASYKGRVVVMDFWGSWCGPCRQELPIIEALYERYKGNPRVAFVGINWERAQGAGEHRTLARDFVAKNNVTFPVVYDHERLAVDPYQIQGFPTVFVVDREGLLRYVNLGFDPHVDEILEAQIRSLLD